MDPKDKLKILSAVADDLDDLELPTGEVVEATEVVNEANDITLLVTTNKRIFRMTLTLHSVLEVVPEANPDAPKPLA